MGEKVNWIAIAMWLLSLHCTQFCGWLGGPGRLGRAISEATGAAATAPEGCPAEGQSATD